MDQMKIGSFLKELRKEKDITQEELAEALCVSNRSVSRWENGRTLPDFDLLIELADHYGVSIDEIMNGRRKEEQTVDKETKDTLYRVAEYTNAEKDRLMRTLHGFAWLAIAAWIIILVTIYLGKTEEGLWETVYSFSTGFAFGTAILTLLYTSVYMGKIQAFKKKLLNRESQ